jgi:hypothetical protein
MASEWIPSLITGVVGVLGMGSALWGGSRARSAQTEQLLLGIGAEDRRARLTERRRVYATYLAALTEVIQIGGRLAERVTTDERKGLESRLYDAMGLLISTMQEVELIASRELGNLVEDITQFVITEIGESESERISLFPKMRKDLYEAMRRDLNEHSNRSQE